MEIINQNMPMHFRRRTIRKATVIMEHRKKMGVLLRRISM
jgi:hypothetical protein